MHAVSAGHVPKNVPRTRTGRTVTPVRVRATKGLVGGPVELLQLLHHRAFPVIELRVLDGRGDVRREGDQRGQVVLWPCVRAAVDSTRWPTTCQLPTGGPPVPRRAGAGQQPRPAGRSRGRRRPRCRRPSSRAEDPLGRPLRPLSRPAVPRLPRLSSPAGARRPRRPQRLSGFGDDTCQDVVQRDRASDLPGDVAYLSFPAGGQGRCRSRPALR